MNNFDIEDAVLIMLKNYFYQKMYLYVFGNPYSFTNFAGLTIH
jgi:hypothetical protein